MGTCSIFLAISQVSPLVTGYPFPVRPFVPQIEGFEYPIQKVKVFSLFPSTN